MAKHKNGRKAIYTTRREGKVMVAQATIVSSSGTKSTKIRIDKVCCNYAGIPIAEGDEVIVRRWELSSPLVLNKKPK